MHPRLTLAVLAVVLVSATPAFAQTVTTRYEAGESFGYVIESRVTMGEGDLLYAERAVTRHDISAGPGVGIETITITDFARTGADGAVTDLTEAAARLEPWVVSLEEMGGVPFPLQIPADLAGALGDIQNLYRAAHPAFGAHRISEVYASYENGEAHSREWASLDGQSRGGNCLSANVQLTRLTDETELYRVILGPPDEACIAMPGEAFEGHVTGTTPDNVFFVSPGETEGRVNVLTGREVNTIYVTLDRATGRILAGELRQVLTVRVTSDCPADFDCVPGYPTEFSRETTLTLIGD
ncbi:hypothetical protein [Hyphobacterium marinum]|uniref:DUF3108 domain-containing protein n=1 Tax=Hyphobacterium marinum TaxID=3116574 RepID=A0ABU7LYN6_9PROT|nr:hypothetical protein [Hyphobacterium sp. Y6023]MEE2566290.1 hypothetical protein [Hyphobacterium sp. Y6023]